MARPRLWRHPRIYAGTDFHQVDCLATVGERIVASGPVAEVRAQIHQLSPSPAQEIILPDDDGSVVIPGLVDAHLHLGAYSRSLDEVDLRGAPDLASVVALVAQHATRGAQVIRGAGWEWQKWLIAKEPTRADLDAVVGDRPVILESQDRHTCWVNTVCLDLLGLPHGSGILREQEGWTAIERLASLPGFAPRSLTECLRDGTKKLLAAGITGVHDMDGEDCRAGLRQLASCGQLALRVVKATRIEALPQALAEGRRSGAAILDSRLIEGPVKVFSDGALGSLTCHMCAPFHGSASSGTSTIDDLWLRSVISQCQDAGLAVAIHAIGDRANMRCLDAFAATVAHRPAGMRHRIEHAQHLRPADLSRFAYLDVAVSGQPAHAISDMCLVEELLGEREVASYAWRSLSASGALLAFGSDAPVEPPKPFAALDAAVHRAPFAVDAPSWQPSERVSPQLALTAHTVGGWRAAGFSGREGVLAPGGMADFVVVSADVLAADSRCYGVRTLTTIVGGDAQHFG